MGERKLTRSEEIENVKQLLEETADSENTTSLLIKLADMVVRYDAAEAEGYARRALRIALAHGDDYWIARAYMVISGCLMNRSDYGRSYRDLKKAWTYLRDLPGCYSEKSELCKHMGLLMSQHRGETRNALRMYRLALEYADQSGSESMRAAVLCFLAESYHNLNLFNRSLECLEEALQIIAENPSASLQAHAEYLTGLIYGYWQEWDFADKRFVKSMELAREIKSLFGEANALRGLGCLAFDQGREDNTAALLNKGLKLLKQSVSLFATIGNQVLQSVVNEEIAQIYVYRKNYRLAFHHYDTAWELAEATGNILLRQTVRASKGAALIQMNDWEGAIAILKEAEAELDGIHLASEIKVHSALAEAYEAINMVAESFFHYKKLIELERKTVRVAVQRKLTELEINDGIRIGAGKSGSTSTPETDVAPYVNERDMLSAELGQRREILENLRKRLLDVGYSPKEKTELAAELLRSIDERNRSINAWELFEKHLSRLNRGGVGRITQRYPSLTEAELRIATLLLLNLSNKEIGTLLNISDRTVDTHRTSIRKKMGLKRKESLVAFLGAL